MSGKQKRISKKNKAFSLAEIMVVLVIIGLLGSIVTISVKSYLLDAKITKAKADIGKLSEGLNNYLGKYGKYPTRDNWKAALTKPSSKFPEPPIKRIPKDPWGREYEYYQNNNGRDFELLSLGADNSVGGEGADADISSKNLEGDDE